MKKIILIICLLIGNFGFSQNYKFGKVSKEEILEQLNPNDSSASATFLYKSHTISYEFRQNEGFVQVLKIHERIKIYNKEDDKWATHFIRLYDNSSTREELETLKAYTYNLVDGKIEKSKLKNESIFEEKNNKYWATTKFTMPNINDGSVIEFEYRIISPFMAIDDIILQEDIPIKKLYVDVRIPEYFVFGKLINPKAQFYPKVNDSKTNRRETINSKERGFRVTEFSSDDLTFLENKSLIDVENVPALKKEPNVSNIDNYRSKIVWEYKYFKSPNGSVKDYSTTWDKVSKTIYDRDSFGNQLEKTSYFEDDITRLIEGVADPIQKASLIYNFVKSKVRWNGFVGYHTELGVRKAYKDGKGNVADINLMLTAMLKYAGLNANPVLISTRDNGIPIIPTTTGFNYVISAIELQGGIILLDASSRYATANILPTRILNWQGRILRANGSSSWINLAPQINANEITALNITINPDYSINGRVRKNFTNHLAMEYRNEFNSLNEEDLIRYLENDKGDIEIISVETKANNDLSKPVQVNYEYKFENGIEEIGDKLYFSPLLFYTPLENPYKQDERLYPIDFGFPFSKKYRVNIMLPEGYEVESLPESSKIKYSTNGTEFVYLAKLNGNVLQLVVELNIKNIIILPKDYEQFQKFFRIVIEKQTEQIVLKKV